MKMLNPYAAKSPTMLQKILLMLTVCLLLGKLSAFRRQPVYIFNLSPLVITSASMQPEYPVNSVVIICKADFDSLEVGDVIAYRSNALGGGLAFHRITREGERGYYTKGDNNRFEDNQLITEDDYVGKAVCQINILARYRQLIASPEGFAAFFILPFAALLATRFALKQSKLI